MQADDWQVSDSDTAIKPFTQVPDSVLMLLPSIQNERASNLLSYKQILCTVSIKFTSREHLNFVQYLRRTVLHCNPCKPTVSCSTQ